MSLTVILQEKEISPKIGSRMEMLQDLSQISVISQSEHLLEHISVFRKEKPSQSQHFSSEFCSQLHFPASTFLKPAKTASKQLCGCSTSKSSDSSLAAPPQNPQFTSTHSSTATAALIKTQSYKLCFYNAYKIPSGSGLGISLGPICCCLFIFLLICQESNIHRVLILQYHRCITEGGTSGLSPYMQAIICCFKKYAL